MVDGFYAWFFIGIVLVAVFMSISLVKKKQSAATFLATIIMIFLVASIGYVYIANDVPLTFQGLFEGAKIYTGWLVSTAKNVVDITAYTIKKDWSANNETG